MMLPTPTYNRAPIAALKGLLSPGGLLAPMLELPARRVAGLELDVHLRSSEIHVYCGLTRILAVGVITDGSVKASAYSTYESQNCAEGIMRTWGPDGARGFREALDVLSRRSGGCRKAHRSGGMGPVPVVSHHPSLDSFRQGGSSSVSVAFLTKRPNNVRGKYDHVRSCTCLSCPEREELVRGRYHRLAGCRSEAGSARRRH